MPSKPLIGILLAAAVMAVLLTIEPWSQSDGPPRSADQAAQELGFYPPAPSTAKGMTTEWREFAGAVDRICATSFNHALGVEARVDQVAATQDWSDGRAEEARLKAWTDQAFTIMRATAALGRPPERADLFSSWRSNVAKRAVLRGHAAQAAGRGRWGVYRDFMNRIYPLKDRGDEIGQRFGLQICTSN